MTSRNPFRSRASEQQRDPDMFLRHFGVGVLDLLPETIWDRPFVIRSAPGGGKTTLLRLFAPESLLLASRHREDFEELAARLTALGVLGSSGPSRFGILLNLSRDYRAILDLEPYTSVAERLFFRLLDARIMARAIRSALISGGYSYPDDVSRLSFAAQPDSAAADAIERFGGVSGNEVHETCREIERSTVRMLDSVLPLDSEQVSGGHRELHSLRLLSSTQVLVDGRPLEAAPMLLLDDGHELPAEFRNALLSALLSRELDLPRWYAERLEVLQIDDLLANEIRGRDYELLEIERQTARYSGAGRSTSFRKFLLGIGDLRAASELERYTHSDRPFTDYLDVSLQMQGPRLDDITARLTALAEECASRSRRYAVWLENAMNNRSGLELAVSLRELLILVERQENKPQRSLFDVAEADEYQKLQGGDSRRAAQLFLAREEKLPYYFGVEDIISCASHNVEQFLRICGEMFEHMLGLIISKERAFVSADQQHRIICRASEAYWRELSVRLSGTEAMTLLRHLLAMGQEQTFRPSAPYPPGVTGFAITVAERDLLLDSKRRARVPGAEELVDALRIAVSRNVLTAESERSVKNKQVVVFYLNRLLCPHFFLPLGRGGFKDRPVSEIAGWMIESPPDVSVPTEQSGALF